MQMQRAIGRYTQPSRQRSGLVRATESWSLSSRTVELNRNGRAPSNFQQKSRNKSRAIVVQPGLPLEAWPDIAILIEKRKRVAILQHANSLVSKTGICQDMMRIS